jgi:hypothetical protein
MDFGQEVAGFTKGARLAVYHDPDAGIDAVLLGPAAGTQCKGDLGHDAGTDGRHPGGSGGGETKGRPMCRRGEAIGLVDDPAVPALSMNQLTEALGCRATVQKAGEPFPRGHSARAVTDAVVLYDQYRDDGPWEKYLAVHRHGGVEAGLGRAAYDLRDIRVFALSSIVGMVCVAAAVQQEAIEKWDLRGPFEATLALRETRGTTLGHFANGWAEPGQGLFDFPHCLENHVLLRAEIEQSIDPERFATIMGDRIELAFGTTNRRHLPRQR